MSMTYRKMINMGVGLVLLAFLGGMGWSVWSSPGGSTSTKRVSPSIAVRVAPPAVRTIEMTTRYLATLEGRHDAALAFRVSGTIGRVYVEEAQAVTAGQKMAALAAPEAGDRVRRARMELARAEAVVAHWQEEHAIDERLYEKGAISKAKRDQSELSLTNAERQRDAALASVREAEHLAKAHVLTAPRDGVVGRIERESGETVMPGQPVFWLNAGRPHVRIDVLARDRERGLSEGSFVRIEADECSSEGGAIERIETAARPPFETVRAWASLPKGCLEDRSFGTTVPVEIVLDRTENAVLVPLSAVDLRGESPRIFRVGSDQKAEALPVDLGDQQGDWQQVIGSVASEDRVVVSGTTNLREGSPVRVVEETSSMNPHRGGDL